jgi:hypothetical protein
MSVASYAIDVALQFVQAAQEHAPKSDGPTSGYVSTLAWSLLAAVSGAFATVAKIMWGHIKKLEDKLEKCQEARVKGLEDQVTLTKTLLEEFDKEGGKK